MIVVYVGKNPPGSSMYLVGQQIVQNGCGVLATSIGETMKGAEMVITLVPEDVPKLEKAKRFLGIGRIVVFLAANWEEYGDWDRGAMLGFAASNTMVVHSRHSFDEVMHTAKSLLAPAVVRRLQNETLVCSLFGVSSEFECSPRDPTQWIVPYNRVNQTQKNLNLHQEITQKFQIAMRGKVQTTFILFGGDGFKKDADLSAYLVVPQPEDRKDYVQLIANKGGFLCTSNFESFGIYYLELLCSGCIGVFMDRPWVRKLLPDYPLIAKNKVEALAMMTSVAKTYPDWYERLTQEIIPFIRKTYDLKRFAQSLKEL